MMRHLCIVSLFAAVIAGGCGGSDSKSSKTAAPNATAPATAASPTAAAVSGLKGKVTLTVSGAVSGAFDGPVTFSGCGVLGANKQGYHVFTTTTVNGHTVDLRFELPNGYHGPGDYGFNKAVSGRIDDQTAKLRWADVTNATGPYGSGTVTMTADTAGSFDVIMLSAAFKTGDPDPPSSQIHVVGTWSCG